MAEVRAGRQPRGGGQEGLRARKMARTRAAIEDAALRLFLERGYAATTIDDIAARGGGLPPHRLALLRLQRGGPLRPRAGDGAHPGGAARRPAPRRSPCSPRPARPWPSWQPRYDATRQRRLSWAHLVRGTPALAGAYLELLAGFEDAVARRCDPQERRGVRPRLQAAVVVAAFRVALERWKGADGDLAPLLAEHFDLLDGDLWR